MRADLDAAGRFDGLAAGEEILISAGGSAWFDAVADVFAKVPALSRPVCRLLRSGAYVSHDDGHYRHITKRDAAYDLGLPTAQVVRRTRDGSPRPATGISVTRFPDQHG